MAKLCRLCAGRKTKLQNIAEIESDLIFWILQVINEKLSDYGINLENLPENICISCLTTVGKFSSFIEKCRDSAVQINLSVANLNKPEENKYDEGISSDFIENAEENYVENYKTEIKDESAEVIIPDNMEDDLFADEQRLKIFMEKQLKRTEVQPVKYSISKINKGRKNKVLKYSSEASENSKKSYDSQKNKLKSDHKKRKRKEERFPCDMCPKIFRKNNCLRAHKESAHSDATEFRQFKCDKPPHSEDRPFKCSRCGKMYKLKSHLKLHMSKHIRGSQFICEYPGCKEAFVNRTSLVKHNNSEHVPHSPEDIEVTHDQSSQEAENILT